MAENENNEKAKWTAEEDAEYLEFYNKVKKRLALGESEDSVFADKPEGFSEWFKIHYKKTGGITLPPLDDRPKTVCWQCGNKYVGNKCPQCGAFKPRK